jgi:hypothetical protein
VPNASASLQAVHVFADAEGNLLAVAELAG